MDTLFEGIKEFSLFDFEVNRELFHKLGKSQKPHTLFIGCSDSRVVPNLITKTLPGELFVIRNIANIVPFYRESEEFLASTSAIEYAVQILDVKNIVICGHSNCGGCNALFQSEKELDRIPHTRKWLELSSKVRDKINNENIQDQSEKECRAEQLNIIEQMNHLITYPYIKNKYRTNEINIYGWYYVIDSGEVYNYEIDQKKFVKIQ